MGCEFSLTFPSSYRNGVEAGCAALDEVERLEQMLSVYREDSHVSALNRSGMTASEVPSELFTLLRLCARLSTVTGGAFNAASGGLVKAWGFFDGQRRMPTVEDIASALDASGSRNIEFDEEQRSVRALRPGIEWNLGAIGKGFGIDMAVARMRAGFGIRSALMQGGGSSLYGLGAPEGDARGWAVDIADPARPDRAIARVHLRNRALGTSAAANQFFEFEGRRYGHVLDPRTGWPADRVLSASALARTAAEADALSTAFFVMGVEGSVEFCRRYPHTGAIILTSEYKTILAGTAEREVVV